MNTTQEQVTAKALKAWHFLYARGFIEGFGHISARIPDSELFLMARHSLGPKAHAGDLLVCDMQGRVVSGNGVLPGEFPIHLEILRARPDIGSIIHYHDMYATAFSTSEHQLKPIHLMGSIFKDGIPTYMDPRLVNNPARGKALAAALGSARVALMRAHGVVTTGATVEEAVTAAFFMEENARRAWLSASMGKPAWLEDEMVAAAGEELLKSGGPFKRVWALVEAETVER